MSDLEAYIAEKESEYGVTLDGNFDTSLTDYCPHPECDCHENMRHDIEAQLRKQKELV
jgi:hypothetical protein